MNSNNIAQRRHSSFIMDRRTISIKIHSLCLLLQVTFALSHACIEHDKQNFGQLQNFGQTTHVSKLYILLSMCCPLILYRHKTMSEAEGLTGCQKIEEQKDDMTKG